MLPSVLARQIRDGLSDLVRSTLDLSTLTFEGMVERFLVRDGAFLKGPWLSIETPFETASEGGEFFPNVPLGYRPYTHQIDAFRRLSYPGAKPTLIATGTGSGKTEGFLWPILDACLKLEGEPGIKAIIIYPMNALATDQAKRIAGAIAKNPKLTKVRCGLYADAEPKDAARRMGPEAVITSRDALRTNPPDILLTNYKMLDYLLVRPRDRLLWSRNEATTLRYLVVDELHTFDGAQGTDLALLIRRLKTRLRVPEGHLAVIGTSATLGDNGKLDDLIHYATEIFGEPFEPGSVVVEKRRSVNDILSSYRLDDLSVPNIVDLGQVVASIDTKSPNETAKELADVVLDRAPQGDPSSPDYRISLGRHVTSHAIFHELLRVTQGRPTSYSVIVNHLAGKRYLEGWSDADLENLIDAFVVLIAHARQGEGGLMRPLLPIRVQTWVRELARMVVAVPGPAGHEFQTAELLHSDDLPKGASSEDPAKPDIRRTLPLVHCRHCGTAGFLGRQPQHAAQTTYWVEPRLLYEGFFEGSTQLRILYPEAIATRRVKTYKAVTPGIFCHKALTFKPAEHNPNDPAQATSIPIWLYDPSGPQGRIDKTCPACGTQNGLAIAGLRAAQAAAAIVSTMFGSVHTDEDKPRLLLFSDSVQDAAQRAAVIDGRNFSVVLRKAIHQDLDAKRGRVSLADLVVRTPVDFRQKAASDASFVATFMPQDLTWMRDYVELQETDELPAGSRLPAQLAYRLGWEILGELTFRARTTQTLESSGMIAVHVDPDLVERTAADVLDRFGDEMGAILDPPSRDEMKHFLLGLFDHMRSRGAIDHPYLVQAVYHATSSYLGYYRAARSGPVIRHIPAAAMPKPRPSVSSKPSFPALGRSDAFDHVAADRPSNWYRSWADKHFTRNQALTSSFHTDLYRLIFGCAERAGVTETLEVNGRHGDVHALASEVIFADLNAATMGCTSCGRRHRVPRSVADAWIGMSCTKPGCDGAFGRDGTRQSSYLGRLFSHPRNRRVIAREHTSLLEAEDRWRLENRFIKGDRDWDPNTLSATPTLEMGIDIGDLSSLLLCSVPPEQANYVQRIGRTGRRDGNSLNVTIVNARPHDLQFWAAPEDMIAGTIQPPGVHLEAIAVLKRQIAAASLDEWVAGLVSTSDFGTVRAALDTIASGDQARFPLVWINYVGLNGSAVADGFLVGLPPRIIADVDLTRAVREFVTSDGEDGLRYRIGLAFEEAKRDHESLLERLRLLKNEAKALQRQQPPPQDVDKLLARLKGNIAAIRKTIRDTITKKDVVGFLTESGVLPNYAFPEEGVRLRSYVYWPEGKDGRPKGSEFVEYSRSAASALSEFALSAAFYAKGRRAFVDRVDLDRCDRRPYRFCDLCPYLEDDALIPADQKSCPKCGSHMWSDVGRRAEMVELKSVSSNMDASEAVIDDADARDVESFDRDLLPSYESRAVEAAFVTEPTAGSPPFGYEFVGACKFYDVNFGPRKDIPLGMEVAGEKRRSLPFPICRECGSLQEAWRPKPGEEPKAGQHYIGCTKRSSTDPSEYLSDVFLHRQFHSEALRVVVPAVGLVGDDIVKSFVAALGIGMRRHFKGRVDHIRSAVVRERSPLGNSVSTLYLYDMVPGGTGFLKEMGINPTKMEAILRTALDHLLACACNSDPELDGCYRCVRSYRTSFGSGTPSRNAAVRMLQAVLQDWASLKPIQAVDDVVRNGFFDSEFESRFVAHLQKEAENGGTFRHIVLPNGRPGYLVRLAENRLWQVETHVLAHRLGIPADTEIDFLFRPVGQVGVKPIAIYLDGWTFHEQQIASDVQKRLRLVRARELEVYSLTWNDFEAKAGAEKHYSDLSIESEVKEGLKTRLTDPRDAIAFEALLDKMPVPYFFARLRDQLAPTPKAVAALLAGAARPELTPPFGEQLSAKGINLPQEMLGALGRKPRVGLGSGGDVRLVWGAGPEALPTRDVPDFRTTPIGLTFDPTRSKDPRADWNGMLHLLNRLQALPGLHVLMPSMEEFPVPDTSIPTGAAAAPQSVWDDIRDLVAGEVAQLIDALVAADLAPPDLIGADLMMGDVVATTIELGWRGTRVGVVLSTRLHDGWKLFTPTEVLADLDRFIAMVRERNGALT